MHTTRWRRTATTVAAAVSTLALLAPSAGATTAPTSYAGASEAVALDLKVQLPALLVGSVAPDGVIHQQVSSTLASLDSTGKANAASRVLSGLINQELLANTAGITHDTKTIVGQNILGIVDVGVGTMEYNADPATQLSRSYSDLAHVNVSLAPLFNGAVPGVNGALAPVQDAVQQATQTVNGLVGTLNGTLNTLQSTLNSATTGLPIQIPQVLPSDLQVPDITKVSLVDLRELWSESISKTDGEFVVSSSKSGLTSASLLGGLISVPAVQFESIAKTNGKPGGAFADAKTTIISVQVANNPLVEVTGDHLKVGGLNLDLSTLGLQQMGIDPSKLGTDPNALLGQITGILTQILSVAGLAVEQGAAHHEVADDGSFAKASTSAFGIGLHPLAAAGPALGGLIGLDLQLMPTAAEVKAANFTKPVTPAAIVPPAPQAAPIVDDKAPADVTPASKLPRTGNNAALVVLGMLTLAGAYTLRRKLVHSS